MSVLYNSGKKNLSKLVFKDELAALHRGWHVKDGAIPLSKKKKDGAISKRPNRPTHCDDDFRALLRTILGLMFCIPFRNIWAKAKDSPKYLGPGFFFVLYLQALLAHKLLPHPNRKVQNGRQVSRLVDAAAAQPPYAVKQSSNCLRHRRRWISSASSMHKCRLGASYPRRTCSSHGLPHAPAACPLNWRPGGLLHKDRERSAGGGLR